ncbi:hypothetical protein KNE206_53690 [Kitasatospora sp. NE20-6]|uniref:hypothetical protein n=1 Tax=Kitasatospora sp. NE20-6 TaxID=2859066 RepID=UPI0034DC8BA2
MSGRIGELTEYRLGEGPQGGLLWRYALSPGESAANPDRLAFHLMAGQQPEPFETEYQGWSMEFTGPIPHALVAKAVACTFDLEPVLRHLDQIPSRHRDAVTIVKVVEADGRTAAATARTTRAAIVGPATAPPPKPADTQQPAPHWRTP